MRKKRGELAELPPTFHKFDLDCTLSIHVIVCSPASFDSPGAEGQHKARWNTVLSTVLVLVLARDYFRNTVVTQNLKYMYVHMLLHYTSFGNSGFFFKTGSFQIGVVGVSNDK